MGKRVSETTRVPKTQVLGTYPKPGFYVPAEIGLRQVEQGFSSFLAIFDYFSKWSVLKVLQNFEKSSNTIAKI